MLRILRIYALKSAVDGSDFGELGFGQLLGVAVEGEALGEDVPILFLE